MARPPLTLREHLCCHRPALPVCLLLTALATHSVANPTVTYDVCANAADGVMGGKRRKWFGKRHADELDEDDLSRDLESVEKRTDQEILADAIRGVGYIIVTKKDYGENDEECKDADLRCEEYADGGECLRNPDFMLEKCRLSCGVCFARGVTPVRFGVEQMVDYYGREEINGKIMAVVRKTREYMFDQVYVEKKFEKVRNDCSNYDRKCSYYAATGRCEEMDGQELRWMQENCSPACQSCLQLEYWHRCGVGPDDVNALEPGDLNAIFERIVGEFPQYSPTVLMRPEPATTEDLPMDGEPYDDDTYFDSFGGDDQDKPWIIALNEFLTPDQCNDLIAEGHKLGYERSITYSDELNEDGKVKDGVKGIARTSSNAWCEGGCNDHPTTRNIMERIANMTGLPEVNSEWVQLLRYTEGQWYDEHHDTAPHWTSMNHGPRVITVFLYLNDVEGGGETRFAKLGLDVTPRRGMALMWPNVLDDDLNVQNDWTWHEARPVKKGVKYGANIWFHLRNYRDNHDGSC